MHETGFLKENINNSDIQKVVREMVVESERKYKVLVENSLVGIAIYSNDRYVYVNPRVTEIIGYEVDDLKDISALEIVHPDDRERIRMRIQERFQGKESDSKNQTKLVCKDGSIVDVIVKSAMFSHNGKPALVINFVDITEIRKAQREIRELSTIIEKAQIPIIKIDTKGFIKYINKSAEIFLKADLTFYENKTLKSMLTGIDPEEMQEYIISHTFKGGFDSDILCKKSTNAPVRMRMTTSPLVDDDNEISAIACFLVDPALQKAERNLLNKE